MRRLILVPCHAVYCSQREIDPFSDEAWSLQPFQKNEAALYVEHIRRGVELADCDPNTRLLFSGGRTRLEAGPRSEAESYIAVARFFSWWGRYAVSKRTDAEAFARDSFENLLFAICRFRQISRFHPDAITVVGWKFKRERFDLHRRAIRFPAERFDYVGVNDPPDLTSAMDGERRNALLPFSRNPYGATGVLAKKRALRNPFRQTPPYANAWPEIAPLLEHLGPEAFTGRLPWRQGYDQSDTP